ncbi:DUF2721 domain-containing protein [Massilia sp. CFBP9012]|uniref:DUF2721 domain-containing protein n=1 Tax=Massilia sp. CFBP9012 TaxID=3096531 RepID=UPI002A6A70FC|nr:DUF2721 domain-containing protein [Massilia sp. CFBP9012]MDY0974375.1 DUF2721 domain-containing protein [Massilia sp. CFBP9012]
MNIQISDIGHVIQLAIAPVFLLTGVATKLTVLTNRLARIIDRTRVLEDRLKVSPNAEFSSELELLYQRSHLINFAIASSTACGLLVCVVIAMLFAGDTTGIPLDQYIAACFVFAMIALISSFVYFLREIFIASKFMRMQHQAIMMLQSPPPPPPASPTAQP